MDDHSLLRSALTSLINSFDGYKVLFEVDNGAEFIKQVNLRNPPDIILLDVTMPIMNGYETAAWIKVNIPTAKVLVLSMMESDTVIIRMLKEGAKGYILKDSKPAVFKNALNELRDKGFYLNELVSNKMLHYLNEDTEHFKHGINLSEREKTFLKLICSEKTYKEIATEMFVSPRTIDAYRDSLFEKTGLNTRVGLVLFAIKNGLYLIQ